MKKMEMNYKVLFESNEDMEHYEDVNEAIMNGDIKISVIDVSVVDEDKNNIEIDMTQADFISKFMKFI